MGCWPQVESVPGSILEEEAVPVFHNEARRARREAAADAARAADRRRIDEALAPYDRAVVALAPPTVVEVARPAVAHMGDHLVIDLRGMPQHPPARVPRRPRPRLEADSFG